MKIDRLLAITIYLLNHEKASASVLADRFSVSVRTIQRDIEALCLAGIPVAAAYGACGGYEILDTFHLEKQAAGQADYRYIMTALQALVSASADPEAAGVLEKVRAASGRQPDEPLQAPAGKEIQMDLSIALDGPGLSSKISLIREAVRKQRQMEFTYTNASGETKLHDVDPVFAVFKWYAWYLIAWYEEKQTYCMFKLIRMQQVRLLDSPIRKKHDAGKVRRELDGLQDTRPYITVKLRGEKSIREKCIEYLHGTVTEELKGGGFILTARLARDDHYWYSTLLGFGTQVRVLEPQELVARIQESCRSILNLYE